MEYILDGTGFSSDWANMCPVIAQLSQLLILKTNQLTLPRALKGNQQLYSKLYNYIRPNARTNVIIVA